MKRVISKRIENLAVAESDSELVNKLTSAVSEQDIENVVKNEGAYLKLFQIVASGVYQTERGRVRFTQKQRAALASVLSQVSEKRLSDEMGKGNVVAKGIAKAQTQEIEMGGDE